MTSLIASLIFRLFVYSFLVWLSAFAVMIDAPSITEESLTEWSEIALALLTAGMCFLIARRDKSKRVLSLVLMWIFVLCIVREFDWLLTFLILGMSLWKWMAIIISTGVVWFIRMNHKILMEQLKQFVSNPSFGMWMAAFLVLFVFSRIVAFRPFWEMVMQENYMPFVRRVVEEGSEFLGYCLFFIASVEYFLTSTKK